MKYLGLDLGTRTLGLAVSDALGLIANPLKTLYFKKYDELIGELLPIIKEYEISEIALGLPKNMDNSCGEAAKRSIKFKALLENYTDIPITLVDERLSTVEALKYLNTAEVNSKKKKTCVDAVAASVILETFLGMKKNERKKIMQSENKNLFTITNDKGEKVECEVILTIESEEFGKNYIVYTDHTMDDLGNIKTYANIYDPTGEKLDLIPIATDEEWDMIESVLASAQKKVLTEQMEGKEEN